jgi:hypothetical protein
VVAHAFIAFGAEQQKASSRLDLERRSRRLPGLLETPKQDRTLSHELAAQPHLGRFASIGRVDAFGRAGDDGSMSTSQGLTTS